MKWEPKEQPQKGQPTKPQGPSKTGSPTQK